MLAARAPFDLIIANILAGPLIELAPAFAKRAAAPGGTIILAGLLDTPGRRGRPRLSRRWASACDRRGPGEWPVLVLRAARRRDSELARA